MQNTASTTELLANSAAEYLLIHLFTYASMSYLRHYISFISFYARTQVGVTCDMYEWHRTKLFSNLKKIRWRFDRKINSNGSMHKPASCQKTLRRVPVKVTFAQPHDITEGFSPIFLSLTQLRTTGERLRNVSTYTVSFVISTRWYHWYKSSVYRLKQTRNKPSIPSGFPPITAKTSTHPVRLWYYLELVVFLCLYLCFL